MSTPPEGTVPNLLLTPPLPARRAEPATVVTVVVAVMIVLQVAAGIYQVLVVSDVRAQAEELQVQSSAQRRIQDVLLCEAARTDALRDTAGRDRQAQERLFADGATPEAAIAYRQRLADGEREREAIAPCPPAR